MAEHQGSPATPRTAAWWARKLHDDLAFAAPELWLMHIERRFTEAIAEAREDAAAPGLREAAIAMVTAVVDRHESHDDVPKAIAAAARRLNILAAAPAAAADARPAEIDVERLAMALRTVTRGSWSTPTRRDPDAQVRQDEAWLRDTARKIVSAYAAPATADTPEAAR